MTTLTLELPTELVARLEQVADETGQPLGIMVADALAAQFAPSATAVRVDDRADAKRIRLRPVRLGGWPSDAAFRRQEIYGDDAR